MKTKTENAKTPVNYQYDSNSRLSQVAQGTQIVGLGYDAAGRRTSLSYPNGVNTTYTYDFASRLTNILHEGPSSIIEDLSYTYDAAGNRISFTRTNDTATLLPDAVQAAYDAANEQIRFDSATANLTYDANGNLTSQTDANGTKTYTWDARNRMVAISGPNVAASFVYDALGRRITKTINGVMTDFQYDGNDIVAEAGGSSIDVTYLRSLNIDELLVRNGINNEYYLADLLGSTISLTDSSGSVITTYNFEPFGRAIALGGSTNSIQFTGRENDGTGLYYYRARFYSPTLQRFISEDPVRFSGGDINLYAYVANNPLVNIDPLGLEKGGGVESADGTLNSAFAVLDAADRVGDALIVFDIANTFVSPTPDVGIIGLGIKAGTKGIEKIIKKRISKSGLKEVVEQTKRLSNKEIKKLKKAGLNPEKLKRDIMGGKASTSKLDLFKDKKGNLFVKPKSGSGPGEPLGININGL